MKINRHTKTRGKMFPDLMNSMNTQRSESFPDLMNATNTHRSAEIGVYKGEFSKTLLRTTDTDLYLIDIWRKIPSGEYDDATNSDSSYMHCLKSISGYEDRAFMLRMRSEKAIELFPDGFFDFIYIDSNHAYEYVKRDIDMWYPKIREGGVLAGHDWIDINWETDTEFESLENGKDKIIYHHGRRNGIFGVNPAVTEFINKTDIELNLTGDKFIQSWFVYKP